MNFDQLSYLLLFASIASAVAWGYYAFTQRNNTVANTTENNKPPQWVETSQFIFALATIILLIRLFDLALVLMTLSVFTGLVWGGYLLLRRLKLSVPATQAAATTTQTGATPDTASKVKEPIIVEFSRFLFPVVIIVFIVRGFVVEPFKIPSESMLPTLEIGDFILVNRFAYGLRLPVFDYKLLDLGSPKRGDVIVFRFPRDPSVDYIKRVVGLPGDRIRYENKHIFINDQQVNYTLLGTYIKQPKYEEYAEKLGDVNHHILLLENSYSSRPFLAEGHEITVPPNQYFAMGDNRDNSSDGRVWGFVPDANLKGRAFLVWFSWAWEAGESPKWSRIGNTIK